jgi:hypothetical protein
MRKRGRPQVEFPPRGRCLYSYNHVGEADFEFCGLHAEKGTAWCMVHHAVVYRAETSVKELGDATK